MVSSTPGPVYSFLHSLPVPSLPFNIEHWVPGSTPLSTTPEVVYAISFYLVVIFGGQALMRGSKPYRESSRSLVLGAAERGCVSAGESGHGDASFASHGLAVWPEGASAGTAEVAEVLGTRATRPIGQLGGAIEGTRRTRSFTLLCADSLSLPCTQASSPCSCSTTSSSRRARPSSSPSCSRRCVPLPPTPLFLLRLYADLRLVPLQILPIVWEHGLFYAICHNDAWTPRMETYYIFNYFVRLLSPSPHCCTSRKSH